MEELSLTSQLSLLQTHCNQLSRNGGPSGGKDDVLFSVDHVGHGRPGHVSGQIHFPDELSSGFVKDIQGGVKSGDLVHFLVCQLSPTSECAQIGEELSSLSHKEQSLGHQDGAVQWPAQPGKIQILKGRMVSRSFT